MKGNRIPRLPIPAALAFSLTAFPQESPQPVTYAEDVAPILRDHCIVCHHPKGIGPFSLLDYEQAKRRARQISEVTQSRFMPPWKPQPGYGPKFIGERRLSAKQIEILDSWSERGAPPGDLAEAPSLEVPDSRWTLGHPDLVLELESDYLLPAEGQDIYRNFLVPVDIGDRVFVRAFELLPETKLAIHHALLTVDGTGESRERDARDPTIGWESMEIGGQPPAGHIMGWTPGQAPYEAYEGTAWELRPGEDLVLQLHMLPTGRPESINPKIGLYLATEPPTRSSYVFQLRNYDLDIPAGDRNYLAEGELELPVDVSVVGLYPHAHYLGKDIQLFATLPDGRTEGLIRIPDWDFNWQGDYRLQDPVFLPAGSALRMRYIYDNSAENPFNPSNPPKRVTGGWRSFDEMAEAMFQVIPENPSDLQTLVDAQLDYDFKLAGGEAKYHYYNGILLEQKNELSQAMAAYLKALKTDSSYPEAYYRAGSLFELRGELTHAERYYKEALRFDPGLEAAKLGLAKAYFKKRRIEPAGEILEALYSNNRDDIDINLWYARFLQAVGRTGEALNLFDAGAGKFDSLPAFHLEHGSLLMRGRSYREAAQAFDKAATSIPVSDTSARQAAYARYMQASCLRSDSQLELADAALDQALALDSDYLEALLMSASVRSYLGNRRGAEASLRSLVARPESETYPYRDIVDNLPLPQGALTLAEVYRQNGNNALAAACLHYAIELLRDRDETDGIELLEEVLRDATRNR